jgi:hypothetical protein
MTTSHKDIDAGKSVQQALDAASYTVDTNGDEFDVGDLRRALAVVNFGVITDGTIDVTLESSDVSGSGYVADTNLTGTVPTGIGTPEDSLSYIFGIDVTKTRRYCRLVFTEATASAGWVASASVVGELKRANSTDS